MRRFAFMNCHATFPFAKNEKREYNCLYVFIWLLGPNAIQLERRSLYYEIFLPWQAITFLSDAALFVFLLSILQTSAARNSISNRLATVIFIHLRILVYIPVEKLRLSSLLRG